MRCRCRAPNRASPFLVRTSPNSNRHRSGPNPLPYPHFTTLLDHSANVTYTPDKRSPRYRGHPWSLPISNVRIRTFHARNRGPAGVLFCFGESLVPNPRTHPLPRGRRTRPQTGHPRRPRNPPGGSRTGPRRLPRRPAPFRTALPANGRPPLRPAR
jgi:hypothetical protein